MRLVINTSHEQGRLELSQTSCNRATRYASPHKSHQLTGPSYISSSSLTKSLPSFLLSLSSHTVGTHKSALQSSQGEREVLFFISEGFPPMFSRGSGGKEWGCSFPHIPVTSPLCLEKTLTQRSADSILKGMNFDRETYIKAPTLHITTSIPSGSLV